MSKTIKAILPAKRPGTRTTLIFDDGTSLKLLPAVAAEQGLFPGLELEEEDLVRLRSANGAASAKQRAVRIISAASVSQKDLEQRLIRKGETPSDAQDAVRWLEELDLVDDTETARQIVARGVSRGYGAERIRQMLYEKRIPRQYWDEALSAMPDMSGALEDFLRKRLGTEPDEKTRRSAVQAALRRGYTWPEINQALCQLKNEE